MFWKILNGNDKEDLAMNIKNKITSDIKPYIAFAEHKDLIAFTVGAEYFTYDYEKDKELEADFDEIIVVVEKDWLFNHMKASGVENPLDFLQNVYVWDDSYEWFISAKESGKIVTLEFC